jgi:hypothetical protein
MKMVSITAVIFLLLGITGCSTPVIRPEKSLFSYTKEEKTVKGGFMGKKKIVTLKDFRENEVYEEDMEDFQKLAQEYVAQHPSLSETAKENLKGMQVTCGSTKEEVEFLLGKPDKIISPTGDNPPGAREIWVYSIHKMHAYTVFIIPVFVAHESYWLHFKDGALQEINRHYIKQVVGQSPGPGLSGAVKK